jgi:Spy/CpxP family protein refolding chaperone
MTTRFKTSLAAALAVATMATAAPMLMADTSAKATVSEQDQEQRRPGPGMRGPGGPGGPGMRRGGPMGLPGFGRLDLSDDQKAQLKQIRESHAAEFKAVRDKSRAAHDGMRDLLAAETINESAIRAKSADVAAAEADMLILNAKVRKESMQILTAEQLAKLKEARESRPRKRQGQQ